MTDRPWLVAIDMQEIFGDPASQWFTPEYERASSGIQRLLPAFGDRAIFTRFVAPTEPRGAWIPYYEQWSFALVPDADPLYALTAPFQSVVERVETRPSFGKMGRGVRGGDGWVIRDGAHRGVDGLLRDLDGARRR